MLLKRKKSWPGLYAGGTLFAPTEDMWLLHLAARPGMSRKDVVRAARRPQDQIATSFRRRGYGETINEQAVLVAIARHLASASWVNDWTWKGSEAPAGVTVVTTAQIRYLSQWLNP